MSYLNPAYLVPLLTALVLGILAIWLFSVDRIALALIPTGLACIWPSIALNLPVIIRIVGLALLAIGILLSLDRRASKTLIYINFLVFLTLSITVPTLQSKVMVYEPGLWNMIGLISLFMFFLHVVGDILARTIFENIPGIRIE